MGTNEEDEMEELQSTVYTFPESVQSVIEQVIIYNIFKFNIFWIFGASWVEQR